MPDVVSIGLLVADIIAGPITAYPETGKLALVENMELHTGGCAVNTGIALAKLSVATSVIGKVGQDAFGHFIMDRLRSHGVATDGIKQVPRAKTSATMVMVNQAKERSFIHYAGANTELQPYDLDFAFIQSHKLLHMGGALLMPKLDGEPAAALLKRARAAGMKTSVDTVWDPTGRWLDVLAPCLPHIDYFLPSLAEARCLSGRQSPEDVADFFLGRGVGVVGLKMGGEGSYIKDTNVAFHLPALSVSVLDTTGAGDGYVAGFLLGALRGWDLERIGRFATAVGACCVSAIGATAGLRDYEQIERMLDHYSGGTQK